MSMHAVAMVLVGGCGLPNWSSISAKVSVLYKICQNKIEKKVAAMIANDFKTREVGRGGQNEQQQWSR